MESRRVYREIEETVETGRFSSVSYPHSIISKSLRHRYHDVRDSRSDMAFYFVATSAFASHGKSKFESAKQVYEELADKFGSSLPFVDAARKRNEAERADAAEVFSEAADRLKEIGKKFADIQAKEDRKAGHDPNKIDL